MCWKAFAAKTALLSFVARKGSVDLRPTGVDKLGGPKAVTIGHEDRYRVPMPPAVFPKAIEALSASIKLARAGLREPEKPIGCYLFSGPTGVGKTEVARQLAATLGVEIIRFDMSGNPAERHTGFRRLIGAPPGLCPSALSSASDKPSGIASHGNTPLRS